MPCQHPGFIAIGCDPDRRIRRQPSIRKAALLHRDISERAQSGKFWRVQLGLQPIQLGNHLANLACAAGRMGLDPVCRFLMGRRLDANRKIPPGSGPLKQPEVPVDVCAVREPAPGTGGDASAVLPLDGLLSERHRKAGALRCPLELCGFGGRLGCFRAGHQRSSPLAALLRVARLALILACALFTAFAIVDVHRVRQRRQNLSPGLDQTGQTADSHPRPVLKVRWTACIREPPPPGCAPGAWRHKGPDR